MGAVAAVGSGSSEDMANALLASACFHCEPANVGLAARWGATELEAELASLFQSRGAFQEGDRHFWPRLQTARQLIASGATNWPRVRALGRLTQRLLDRALLAACGVVGKHGREGLHDVHGETDGDHDDLSVPAATTQSKTAFHAEGFECALDLGASVSSAHRALVALLRFTCPPAAAICRLLDLLETNVGKVNDMWREIPREYYHSANSPDAILVVAEWWVAKRPQCPLPERLFHRACVDKHLPLLEFCLGRMRLRRHVLEWGFRISFATRRGPFCSEVTDRLHSLQSQPFRPTLLLQSAKTAVDLHGWTGDAALAWLGKQAGWQDGWWRSLLVWLLGCLETEPDRDGRAALCHTCHYVMSVPLVQPRTGIFTLHQLRDAEIPSSRQLLHHYHYDDAIYVQLVEAGIAPALLASHLADFHQFFQRVHIRRAAVASLLLTLLACADLCPLVAAFVLD